MASIKIQRRDKTISGEIRLPASKSISNRVLILRELATSPFETENLSIAEDTKLLAGLLEKIKWVSNSPTPIELNCQNAGTVYRFLTAYLANSQGKWILTGSGRMKERPVQNLVKALIDLGADITYKGRTGYPPILIEGKKLAGGKITIDSSVSSQYISALLMIAPTLHGGLEVTLEGHISSEPYIEMTLQLLSHFGIVYQRQGNSIKIAQQQIISRDISIEPDWSSAAFWYEMVALSDNAEIYLDGFIPSALMLASGQMDLLQSGDIPQYSKLQGDSILPGIFKSFGVATKWLDNGLKLFVKKDKVSNFEFDFTNYPDLAQPVIVTCSALNISSRFIGLESLRIKETDRIKALVTELQKCGFNIRTTTQAEIIIQKSRQETFPKKLIKTYGDHRMAMSFAPLALQFDTIEMDDPEIVLKSYPGYWADLKKAGFILNGV
ncbi:MAG: 3-phosphoshikimate 1-carboxyvinyltransferase [Bacteroidales bacterium]|nr:3-phosphoshikimate 1-carboxyvinyltransferase [Bacteroidales bacterium]